jgi:hypothetical protein
MALIKSVSKNVFDSSAVYPGNCIRARKSGWDCFLNGFITAVTQEKITCLYYVSSGNAANYFDISPEEIAAGLWEIYWTADFQNIFSQGVTDSA